MNNFWDFSVWGSFHLLAVLLVSLLAANILKRTVKFLRVSLIPTSVLGGGILIIVAAIYKAITGDVMFDTAFFGGKGTATMDVVTYHTLALGFIASAFRPAQGKMTKKRTAEIFNTGVTTVATYLLQAVVGLGITIVIAAFFLPNFFPAAGVLGAENAGARHGAEDGDVKDKDKLVGDGHAGHGLGADPAHHHVVQQTGQVGDAVLYHHRQGQIQHPLVKSPVTDEFFQKIRHWDDLAFILCRPTGSLSDLAIIRAPRSGAYRIVFSGDMCGGKNYRQGDDPKKGHVPLLWASWSHEA